MIFLQYLTIQNFKITDIEDLKVFKKTTPRYRVKSYNNRRRKKYIISLVELYFLFKSFLA